MSRDDLHRASKLLKNLITSHLTRSLDHEDLPILKNIKTILDMVEDPDLQRWVSSLRERLSKCFRLVYGNCTVCQEELKDDTYILLEHCSHPIHWDCAVELLKNLPVRTETEIADSYPFVPIRARCYPVSRCPVCRTEFHF